MVFPFMSLGGSITPKILFPRLQNRLQKINKNSPLRGCFGYNLDMHLTIKVIPNASRESVELKGGVYVVRVRAVPEKGKANEAIIKMLSKHFGVAKNKLKINVENIFLKTGTTNDNKESLAIIQRANTTYTILRNENPSYDNSKEGNLMKYIKKSLRLIDNIKKPNRNYKW